MAAEKKAAAGHESAEHDVRDENARGYRKVRRGYIAQKYAALIDALYGDQDHVSVEATVTYTYEDGRTVEEHQLVQVVEGDGGDLLIDGYDRL